MLRSYSVFSFSSKEIYFSPFLLPLCLIKHKNSNKATAMHTAGTATILAVDDDDNNTSSWTQITCWWLK